MFEHILVAVDGSREASKTIPAAVDLAEKFGSKVTVVHVREHERYEGDDVDLGPPMSADDIVNGAIEAFGDAGITADGVIRRVRAGGAPEEIVQTALDVGATLIVMGTRGLTEWRSLLIGGVANKVVHHAHCPVLLVR
jgi:nucleotide-binding universal stress UspA family protein